MTKRIILILCALTLWYGVSVSETPAQKKKPKAKPAAKPNDGSVDPPADRSDLPIGAQDMLNIEVPKIREQQRREAEERRKAAREGREPNLPDPNKKDEKKEEKKDDGKVVNVGKPTGGDEKPAEPTPETPAQTPETPTAPPIGGPPTESAPAQKPGAVVVRRGEVALRANALTKADPVQKPGSAGTVILEVTVDETGQVATAKVLSGPALLHRSAIDAARKWTFKPVMFGNQPARVIGTLTFQFK